MKKKTKKLVLAKETVRTLELNSVHGGSVASCSCSCGCPSIEITCENEFLSINNC